MLYGTEAQPGYLDLCLKSDWQQESVYLQETGPSITLVMPRLCHSPFWVLIKLQYLYLVLVWRASPSSKSLPGGNFVFEMPWHSPNCLL